jgi:hypothetical protein
MLVTRQQILEEYDLADLLLVLSSKAEGNFSRRGCAAGKALPTSARCGYRTIHARAETSGNLPRGLLSARSFNARVSITCSKSGIA